LSYDGLEITMNYERLLSLLGLARKAKLASFGHDAAKSAIRSKHAKLCLLCNDASERLSKEFLFLTQEEKVPLREIDLTSLDIRAATQYKAAVVTVDNNGFAKKMLDILDI